MNEGAIVGYSVAKMTAYDADSGVNKQIQYALVSGNTNERFSIDSNSGTVTLKRPIERDPPNNEKNFDLTVSTIYDLCIVSDKLKL